MKIQMFNSSFLKKTTAFIATTALVFGGFFMFTLSALAATNGPNNPGTVVNETGIGTVAWADPSNAQILDSSYTTATFLSGTPVSNYLKATNYGFAIPDDATILGIEVGISRKANVADKIKDKEVKLVKGGTIGGDNNAVVGNWPTTEAIANYGGSSNLWGQTWTASDVNSPNFGLAISADNFAPGSTPRIASINSVQITITYAVPVQPPAPLVTNDDTANTVTGMALGMEYNLDSAGYVAYDAGTFNALNFSGDHTLLVRVAAEGINPASNPTTLTFTTNPPAPDLTAPVITRLGNDPVNLTVSDPAYVDAGATALDNVDGNITANIVTTVMPGPVDTSAPGIFTVHYNVSDAAHNPASEVTRTVNVNVTPVPVIPTLVSSVPPNNAVMAQDGSGPGWNLVTLSFSPALAADWNLTSNYSISTTNLTPINIASISGSTTQPEVNLSRPLVPGERVTITHQPTNSSICLGFLPGDVTQDGRFNVTDIGALRYWVDPANGVTGKPLYQTDINRDGVLNDNDLTRLRELRSATDVILTLPACRPALTTITVSPATPSIVAGTNQQFTATGLDQFHMSFATTPTWTSSDLAVATIDPVTGLATGLTAGQTTITATDGLVSSFTTLTVAVTVDQITQINFTTAPQTIEVNTASARLTTQTQNTGGESKSVNATTILNYTSSSGTGQFSGANSTTCTGVFSNAPFSLTMSNGTANKNFCYRDSTPGTHTLIVTADGHPGWTPATQIITVNGVVPPSDTTPNDFTFVDQTGVLLSTVITSNTITISGINATSPISITNGEYSINDGAYTSVAGTVAVGNTVKVHHTSSALNSTAVNTVLTIGGVSDTFTSTTVAPVPDITPIFDKTITTEAGKWVLISAPKLLSEAPTIDGGAVALLVYRNGTFVIPAISDNELINPLSAFYIKTTNAGEIGFNFVTINNPTQVSRQLNAGWNLVGTNDDGLAEDELATLQPEMTALYVPNANSGKDTGYTSWGDGDDAGDQFNANPITSLPDHNLSVYDGYWINMNAAKTFTKNL